MFWIREYSDEPPKYQVEAGFRVLRRKLGNRWLRADYELQLRDQVCNKQAVRIQRLSKLVTPFAQLDLALTKKLTNEALKGLRQRGVRYVAFVLVELA